MYKLAKYKQCSLRVFSFVFVFSLFFRQHYYSRMLATVAHMKSLSVLGYVNMGPIWPSALKVYKESTENKRPQQRKTNFSIVKNTAKLYM